MIPASHIVQINPGVVTGGGNPLSMNGVILTKNRSIPIGSVYPFFSADDVGAFFGMDSLEYDLSVIYFNGYDNKQKTPSILYFSQYADVDVSAWVRSGSLAGISLETLKTYSGTLNIDIDGVEQLGTIDLSTATSFSDAASIIQNGFEGLPGTVTYSSLLHAFVITASSADATSTISYCTGTLASNLKLTYSTGAVLSQGADAETPGDHMANVKIKTLNWVMYMTAWEPNLASKKLFAEWANSQNKRFIYVAWDTSSDAIVEYNTTALGPYLNSIASNATCCITGDAALIESQGSDTIGYRLVRKAAFIMGTCASIDYTRFNGRLNFAFKHQSALPFDIGDRTTADIAQANGYNFYGGWATANDQFMGLYPGIVSGDTKWLGLLVDQIWLTQQQELALMNLLFTARFIDYGNQGKARISAALQDPTNQALNAGIIQVGIPLSEAQAAQVNGEAGTEIDKTLTYQGWYLQVGDATSQTREAGGSPPVSYWYVGASSINRIELPSIVVM